jgi:RND family efflux transporter MFP subunit
MSVDSHVVRQNLNIVKAFLDEAALAVNILQPSSSLSQTTIDKYKADISSARTNINIAIANVTSAEEKFSVAQSNLLLAQNELVLKQAGNVPEQIASQEAAVAKAQASVSNAEAQLTKTVLRAPIGGIVTRQDAKVGQIVAPNIAIVSLASVADFQIEAAMPEADIAKIAIGQEARVTLDAYGSDLVFNAKVVKIDPAETIIDGVSTYKVTLQFVKNDNHIKSGMTANIDIEGEVHTGVLSVPQRVVVSRDSDKFVNILDGDNVREVKVKTGLRGSDGSVEILEGLREGDKVLTSYAAQ